MDPYNDDFIQFDQFELFNSTSKEYIDYQISGHTMLLCILTCLYFGSSIYLLGFYQNLHNKIESMNRRINILTTQVNLIEEEIDNLVDDSNSSDADNSNSSDDDNDADDENQKEEVYNSESDRSTHTRSPYLLRSKYKEL